MCISNKSCHSNFTKREAQYCLLEENLTHFQNYFFLCRNNTEITFYPLECGQPEWTKSSYSGLLLLLICLHKQNCGLSVEVQDWQITGLIKRHIACTAFVEQQLLNDRLNELSRLLPFTALQLFYLKLFAIIWRLTNKFLPCFWKDTGRLNWT